LTEEERRAIRVVSMDMWGAYRQAVRKRLRYAEIVADRFHVMKQLNHQIDLMRRSIQRRAKKEGNEALYQALKGSRWVLLKNRHTLAPEQGTQLGKILAVSDELRTIYLLKEEFHIICDKITDRTRAQRFVWAWTGKALAVGGRYLSRFVKTLQNWWHEFLNYFDDLSRMRQVCASLLPGAEVRRHLLWRYSIVWRKTALSSWNGGRRDEVSDRASAAAVYRGR